MATRLELPVQVGTNSEQSSPLGARAHSDGRGAQSFGTGAARPERRSNSGALEFGAVEDATK